MKKNQHFAILFLIFLTSNLNAQSCLPNGIFFETQEQVDSFRINHPGCTTILGNVEFDDDSQVSTLDSLIDITKINGRLDFDDTNFSIDLGGLINVTSTGGLRLEDTNGFGNFKG